MSEIHKKAFKDAEQELEKEAIVKLKEVIKKTLERIKEVDKKIKELEEERKILKLDIEDLKEGRLDRIEERQKKDTKAKEVSVIKVEKEKVVESHHYHTIYQPYRVDWNYPSPTVWCTTPVKTNLDYTVTYNSAINTSGFTLTNNIAKFNTSGTYLLDNSTDPVHLR